MTQNFFANTSLERKVLFLSAFLFLTGLGIFALFSQDVDVSTLPKRTGIQRVFGEKGNFREKPGIKAKLISQIPTGASLKILKRTEEVMTVDGTTDYWYQIQHNSKNGFLWGGFLSDHIYEEDFNLDGEKEILLIKDYTKVRDTVHLKLVKNNQLISELERKMGDVANFSVKVLPGDKFDPQFTLFALYYLDSNELELAHPKVDIYYLDKEKKLSLGFSYSEKNCDPPGCKEVTAIFPGEIARGKRPGGEPNKIILHTHSYDLDNESFHEYSRNDYSWNGDEFIQSK